MPHRLPLLIALLLLSALLLTAGAAHGASAEPEPAPLALDEPLEEEGDEGNEEEVTECEVAEEEVEEGELKQSEADEICDEESADARPAPHPRRGKDGHHAHRHKKSCRRHKAAAGKRRCAQRR